MQTVNSKVILSPASDIIYALQNILCSHGIIGPDLETPYSQSSLPNMNHPAIEITGESISAIVTERQQQLDAVLRDISGLETVMDSIKNLYQQLVEQKDKITQSMTFHKGLVSSLWRLPPEVLSQIFHHCLPGDKYFSPVAMPIPMLLTRICRPWREVAVDMSSLWCRLYMTTDISRVWQEEDEDVDDRGWGELDEEFDDSDWEELDDEVADRDWQRLAFCYNSWLKRSRGLPLSLVVKCYHPPRLLRSLLQPYINQISNLSIHFTPGVCRTGLLLKDVPALQELVILGMRDSAIPNMMKHISQLASTMRVLDVGRSMFGIRHLSSLNPIWAHLTHVKIGLHDLDAFFELLRLCPNLSSLTAFTSFYEQWTPGSFTHANIQSLHLADNYGFDINHHLPLLFNPLSLPNLRVLDIHCAHGVPRHQELKEFLARSKCPLEHLIFRSWATDVSQAEYVALIPSLNVVVYPPDT